MLDCVHANKVMYRFTALTCVAKEAPDENPDTVMRPLSTLNSGRTSNWDLVTDANSVRKTKGMADDFILNEFATMISLSFGNKVIDNRR